MSEEREQPDWVYAIWREKGWDRMAAEALPEPDEEMSWKEKGALLLRYMATGRWMVKKTPPPEPGALRVALDFRKAHLEGADLQGADLQGADLKGANLQGANLWEADLQRADLSGANLQGANLQGADLKRAQYNSRTQWPEGFEYRTIGAIGPQANLQRAYLKGANLQGADLSGVYLQRANLQEASLHRADLQGADLKGADLQGADLQGADLKGADLQGADLQGADLRQANLQEASLWEADLQGAHLQGAKLQGTDFEGFIFSHRDMSSCDFRESILNRSIFQSTSLHRTKFRGCPMQGSKFENSDLRGSDLTNADLSEADLNGADLTESTLREATFVGAQMKKADLTMVSAEKANFSGADLADADLRHANLSETQFLGTKLIRAKLYQANLSQARMDSVDLTDADLSHANLNDARLYGVRGTPKSCTQATLTAQTYYRSEWNTAILTQWLRMGAILPQMEFLRLRDEVQHAILRNRMGLTLYFSRPLSRTDRFIVDGVIVGAQRLLGRETDCEVEEYKKLSDTSSFIRLQASRQQDLLLVAELFHKELRTERQAAPHADADIEPEDDGWFCLTLKFDGPLTSSSEYLIMGVLSDPSKELGQETDVGTELSLVGEAPYLRLRSRHTADLRRLRDFLRKNLKELAPVQPTAMMPIFHALNPALYDQVRNIAEAVMPEKTEMWVKGEDGKPKERNVEDEFKREARAASVLSVLLQKLFDDAELKQWLAGFDAGAAVVSQLPGKGASLRDVADTAAKATQRRGFVPQLIQQLLQDRPGRTEDIQQAEEDWKCIMEN